MDAVIKQELQKHVAENKRKADISEEEAQHHLDLYNRAMRRREQHEHLAQGIDVLIKMEEAGANLDEAFSGLVASLKVTA